MQFNPTGILASALRPRSESRPDCSACDSAVKGETLVQHVELPELAWQLDHCLRSGVTEAVTLLAKAMAVTKETRDL
jgi:hypothetical protein